VYIEHDRTRPETWELIGYEPVKPARELWFDEARAALAREFFPKIEHHHTCPPKDPPVHEEVGGGWDEEEIENPEPGVSQNRFFFWYVMNSSVSCPPSGCEDQGAIGTTVLETHYLIGDGFANYPAPAFAGEMELGDEVWVLWSFGPSADGNGPVCFNTQWLALDDSSGQVWRIQIGEMDVTHPSARAGTAYTTSAEFITQIPNDPGLIGLELFQQVWFRDVSEIGDDGEWPHAGHGDHWLIHGG
jgi:hypothetical protein